MSPTDAVIELRAEIIRLQNWIDDLQSRMYINCVYCGHRYGPEDTTPATVVDAITNGTPSMADVLKAHIEKCPKHPMNVLKAHNVQLLGVLQRLRSDIDSVL